MSSEECTTKPMSYRKPTRADAPRIHELVRSCPPLEINSCYAYLILCEHFADTCVVAESEGELVGVVTAYVPPNAPDTLFVWQVAVDANVRGQGVGRAMLGELAARDANRTRRILETTVTPSNDASARMFESFARTMKAPIKQRVLFRSEDFDTPHHEDEVIIRIGPMTSTVPADLSVSQTEQKETSCASQS